MSRAGEGIAVSRRKAACYGEPDQQPLIFAKHRMAFDHRRELHIGFGKHQMDDPGMCIFRARGRGPFLQRPTGIISAITLA